tara:strand:+ start:2723 stop:3238 length:516 start_codon:yes stop_codon:yes gene_type:complete
MRSKLIISANGLDEKGIVSKISSIIGKHNANIETSKMIRLENEFAMLILINIQNEKIKMLTKSLNQINELSINLIETNTNENILYENKFHLYINGADNEGIVYTFSKFLSEIDINIDEVNTKIKNAPMSATPLFMMDLIIGSKSKINEKDLNEKLNGVGEKLGVEVTIQKF